MCIRDRLYSVRQHRSEAPLPSTSYHPLRWHPVSGPHPPHAAFRGTQACGEPNRGIGREVGAIEAAGAQGRTLLRRLLHDGHRDGYTLLLPQKHIGTHEAVLILHDGTWNAQLGQHARLALS